MVAHAVHVYVHLYVCTILKLYINLHVLLRLYIWFVTSFIVVMCEVGVSVVVPCM